MVKPSFKGIFTGSFYKPFYFMAPELCSREAHDALGAKIFRYINPKVTFSADQLRHNFGSATINNWFWGGDRQYSGLRLHGEPHYSPTSDHSYGNALDMIFKTATAQEVRNHIEANPDLYPFITFVEEGYSVNWLHISVSNVASTFRPRNKTSIIFWNADTGGYREVPRSEDFSISSFNEGVAK